jgi:hypothetical protein
MKPAGQAPLEKGLFMIYVTHGAVPDRRPELFIHRNMVDEVRFVQWLQARATPFVKLSDALECRGDALTIDDGTRAAARAAKLAVSFGHAVCVFVNPYHSISDKHYFFALINAALDDCRREFVDWRSRVYDFRSWRERRYFRVKVKEELRGLTSEAQRASLVQECLACLDKSDIQPPHHLRALRVQELVELRDFGVAIENHAWTHGDFSKLDPNAVLAEIESASCWIEKSLETESSYFAAPFGEALPPRSVRRKWKTWFLLTDRSTAGWVSSEVYNRQEVNP